MAKAAADLAAGESWNPRPGRLGHFYRWIEPAPARGRGEDLPQAARRALTVEETHPLLRAAERGALPGSAGGGVRDRAIVTVVLLRALRIAELGALGTSDVAISAAQGLVTVRRGQR